MRIHIRHETFYAYETPLSYSVQRLYLTRTKPLDGPGRRPDGHSRGNWPGGQRRGDQPVENGLVAGNERRALIHHPCTLARNDGSVKCP